MHNSCTTGCSNSQAAAQQTRLPVAAAVQCRLLSSKGVMQHLSSQRQSAKKQVRMQLRAATIAAVAAFTMHWLTCTRQCFSCFAVNAGSSSSFSSNGGSSTAGAIRCCRCQQACHISCLPAALHQQYAGEPAQPSPKPPGKSSKAGRGRKEQETEREQQNHEKQQLVDPYFCSPSCQQIATHLAQRCALGVVQVDALTDGTPVAWQLIQPAAVAAALTAPAAAGAEGTIKDVAAAQTAVAGAPPEAVQTGKPAPGSAGSTPPVGLLGTGVAAGYSGAQAEVLAQVLRDVLRLLSRQLGAAWEVRTYQDALPWLLGGLRQQTPGGLLDLSHFHVAVLWVGSTLAASSLLRLHGPAVLEVSVAATQEELQHRQLGRMLVACVERFALETCRVSQAWMPALGGAVKPCVGECWQPSAALAVACGLVAAQAVHVTYQLHAA